MRFEVRMRRTVLFFSILTTVSANPALAQATPPTLATDIPAAAIQAVLNSQPPAGDKLIKSIDIGGYAVGVGILHRGTTRPGAPVGAINHTQLTEIYYVISGTATLLTGGTVTNVNAIAADSDIVKIDVGPSNQGVFERAAQRRKIGPGDVVIIPAGVYHGFDDVAGGIDYLAFRTDPNHVLPKDYVHPAAK
jgi:mannose-6-phosphate isomerase-like protein (cupin superfamily)